MKFKNNIIAFIAIGLLGTLGHFFYEWSGDNFFVGLFFPVNESTWEHLKLLFFPTLIYSLFEYAFAEKKPCNYLPAVTISLIWGMGTIIALFYTVKGVLGFNVDIINIAIYFIAIISMLIKKNKIIKKQNFCSAAAFWISLILIAVTAILFISFSFNPPSIGLFTPPTSN